MGKMLRCNKHHLWWPKSDYKTKLERSFRELPCNVIRIDTVLHELIHLFATAPIKPTREEMMLMINRHREMKCGCYVRSPFFGEV